MTDILAPFKSSNTLADLKRFAEGPISFSNVTEFGPGVVGATAKVFGTKAVYFLRGDASSDSSMIVGRIELPSDDDVRGPDVEDFHAVVFRGSGIMGGERVGTI